MTTVKYKNLWHDKEMEWDPDGGIFVYKRNSDSSGAGLQRTREAALADLALAIARSELDHDTYSPERPMPDWSAVRLYKAPCLFSDDRGWIEQPPVVFPDGLLDEARKAALADRGLTRSYSQDAFRAKYSLSQVFM